MMVQMRRAASLLVLGHCSAAFVGTPAPASRTSGRPAVRMEVAAPPASEFQKASFDTSIDGVPKCPLTVWDSDGIDLKAAVAAAPAIDRTLPDLIQASDIPEGMSELEFFRANKDELLARLTESGALWIRGFETMKEKDGFRAFYEQL